MNIIVKQRMWHLCLAIAIIAFVTISMVVIQQCVNREVGVQANRSEIVVLS